MIKRYFIVLSLLGIIGFVSGLFPVFADVTCTTQYGGGQTCVRTGQLLVDKKVWDGSAYVDNLFATSSKFQNGDEVTFQINIKNVGDTTLSNVTYTDTLPAYYSWSEGDGLTGTIGTLEVGQTVTKTIKAKITGAPAGVVCNVNTAAARASDGSFDQDTAQVCAGQPVLGVTTIPQTGPETGILMLLPAVGTFGYFLRKVKAS